MKGLSFVNIGNGLVFSAGMLSKLDQDDEALSWVEFLMSQYVNSRHPETKLGCYQFNRPKNWAMRLPMKVTLNLPFPFGGIVLSVSLALNMVRLPKKPGCYLKWTKRL